MDRYQSRLALLKMISIFLGLSSWVFWSFIFSTRPEQAKSKADPLSSLVRLPASLPSELPSQIPQVFQGGVKPAEPIQMESAKLPCLDRGASRLNISARWLRVTGRVCDQVKPTDQIEIRNLSNGYQATIFPGEKGITTDYIPFNAGENELEIRIGRDGDAELERHLMIVRE